MRTLEVKHKRAFSHTQLLNKLDAVVEVKFKDAKSEVLKKKHEVVFFITHNVPFYIWNKTRDMTGGLRKKYEKIERTIRGRNMIKQMGEASEYMKNISEHKNVVSKEIVVESVSEPVAHPDFTAEATEDRINQ